MYKRLALVLMTVVAVIAAVAGCSSAPAGSSDPYQLMFQAQSANRSWEQVQVNVGINAQGGDTPVTIDPNALKFAIDTKGGRALIHVALPVKSLGVEPSMLAGLGITGDTLDVDILFDGTALYAKSPAASSLITLLSIQGGGELPSGDLAGWIKLGTKADFEALAGSVGGGTVTPSTEPMETFPSAADMKAKLEAAGVTLTYAGSAQHAGVDANHLTVAVDMTKLAASDLFSKALPSQLESFKTAAEKATITGDLWLDKGNSRIVGVDVHGVSKDTSGEKFDVTVTLKAPDAGTSFDAPSSFVDFPISNLLTQLMGSFMGGGLTQ